MMNPPHPGLSVRHDCLEPLNLSATEAARKLGISRKQLSDNVVLNLVKFYELNFSNFKAGEFNC